MMVASHEGDNYQCFCVAGYYHFNNYEFCFKHRMVNGLSEYWLVEK